MPFICWYFHIAKLASFIFQNFKTIKNIFYEHRSEVYSADRVCLQVIVCTVFTQVWPYSTVTTVL